VELVLGIAGSLVMLGALALAFVRPPQWMGDSDPESKRGQMIRRWGGYQRIVRRCINAVLGLIGALVFVIQQADGFWPGVVGVLKALVWPAFLVYELLKHAGA